MRKKLNMIFAKSNKAMTILLNLLDRFNRLSNFLHTNLDF